ncbi:hypothetical protein WJX74_008281 [Apatococcus lobatus]|uniref:Uncharacterized protein n=1 Tax=Apatococcus lobatus TaxID=904363 RepID=A0AAW1RM43_9CHLO
MDIALAASVVGRRLLHGGEEHGDADEPHESTHTLKWVFAAVIFLESLLGILLPFLLKSRLRLFQSPKFLSIINCFAGGVFLTFGFMHLLPDAAEDAEDLEIENYPTAYLFATVGFFLVFFVQKVLTPLLVPTEGDFGSQQGRSCCTTGATAILGNATLAPQGVPAKDGKMSIGKPFDEEAGPGMNGCSCDNTAVQRPRASGALAWIAPIILFLGLCVHSVFEGLAVGLQTTNAAVVTAGVAMVTHKWVESIALSSMCIRARAKAWQILLVLLAFGVMAFVGVAIGVAVTDSSPWTEMVLFGLISGGFIYIGGYEIIHGEFSPGCSSRISSRMWRVVQFTAMFLGALLVALLQLVHGS